MEGIPLAFVTERFPMLELYVTGNLECTVKIFIIKEADFLKTLHENLPIRYGNCNSLNLNQRILHREKSLDSSPKLGLFQGVI